MNILIIDGGKTFAHSKGELNHTLTEVAASQLRDLGHQVTLLWPTATMLSRMKCRSISTATW